jgi:H+-transporting ATPase
LFLAVLGTQAVATLIAVYGLFMTPLGWGWALFVWGYALAWFLVNDPIKLLAYRILDATKKAAPKQRGEAKPKADAVKPDSANLAETKTAEPEPVAASEPQPDVTGDGAKAGAAAPEAPKSSQARPDAASGPQPDVNADNAASRVPKAGAAKPDAAKGAEIEPDVKVEPEAETNANYTKLMHTTLGDVLLAGLAKDPHSVERIVAEAVTKAEAAPKLHSHKHTTPKPSRSGKPKPSPSGHPKLSPKRKPAPTRRPK